MKSSARCKCALKILIIVVLIDKQPYMEHGRENEEMLSSADEDDAWGPTSMWVKIFQNQYQQGVYLPNSDNRAKGNVRATTNSRDGNFGLARDMSRLPVSNVSCETWFQDPTPVCDPKAIL